MLHGVAHWCSLPNLMHNDRYIGGRSTPRPVRFNDLLWSDFARFAKKQGMTAADALRQAMIETLDRHGAATIKKPTSVPITHPRVPSADVTIELDLE